MTSMDGPGISADERVYRGIYDAVQALRLAPGAKLREVELSRLFSVSRTSVRSALLRLSETGIVALSPHRGAAVAELSPQDGRELLEARRAIEGRVVELLAKSASPQAIRALRQHVRAQRKAFESGDVEEGHRLAIAFHQRMADLAGNRVLAQFLDKLLARMPLVILTLGRRAPGDATHAEHIELVEAIAARDAAKARRILLAHLAHLEAEIDRAPPARTLGELLGRTR